MSKLAERITDLPLKDDLDEAAGDALRVAGGDPMVAIKALISASGRCRRRMRSGSRRATSVGGLGRDRRGKTT